MSALTALPLVVFLHIYFSQEQTEQTIYRIIELLSESSLGRDMQGAAEQLALQVPPTQSTIGKATTSTIPVRFSHEIPLNDAMELGESDLLTDCGHLQPYGSIAVSFKCASLDLEKGSPPELATRALKLANLKGIGKILRGIYQNPFLAPSNKNAGPDLPTVAFVYALVPVDGYEALIIYPGLALDSSYNFKTRPWYRPAGHVKNFLVSRIYHDYATSDSIVSLSREALAGNKKVRVFADYRVHPVGTGIELYLLNALIAIVALSAYSRSYLRTRHLYQKYLVISTALLALAYVLLVLNHIVSLSWSAGVTNGWLVNKVLPFLPSGSFLLLASLALIGRLRYTVRVFILAYAGEFCGALIAVKANNVAVSAAYGCLTLVFFGWCLKTAGNSYRVSHRALMNPQPRQIANYGFLSYSFWGAAQFSLFLFGRGSSQMWSYAAPILAHWGWGDLLLSEVGGFILLLYAKAVAIFITIAFIYSSELMSVWDAVQGSEAHPYFILDDSAVIIDFQDFPLDFRFSRRPFADLLNDDEDRREFEFAFKADADLSSYLCRMPELFGDSLVSISLDRREARRDPRRVYLQRFDESRLLKKLDRTACERLIRSVEGLREKLSRFRASAQSVDIDNEAIAGLHAYLADTGREILERSHRELLTLREKSLVKEAKSDFGAIWKIFDQEVTTFGSRVGPSIVVSSPTPDISSFPHRVRVSLDIWKLIVTSIFHELRQVSSGSQIEVEISPPAQGSALSGRHFITLRLAMPSSDQLRTSFSRMRLGLLFDGRSESSEETPGHGLYFSRNLLLDFDGDLSGFEIGRSIVLEVMLRPLYSSEENYVKD